MLRIFARADDRIMTAKRRFDDKVAAGFHQTGTIAGYNYRPFGPGQLAMDLLLWRHADEAQHDDDLRRPLTVRGEKQARSVAKWIRRQAPKDLLILVSPALRARQSAETLGLPFEIRPQLGPKSQASDLLAAAGWPDGMGKRHGAVLLVSHQPALGQLAALLLAGNESAWTIKKGALWWFTNRVRAGETQTVLRAVVCPDQADGG